MRVHATAAMLAAAGLAAAATVWAGDGPARRDAGFPSFQFGAPMPEHLAGPSGKGEWTTLGGSCRRPALIFSRGSMGLTVRFASADDEGSRASFSTAEASGVPENFTLRYDRLDPDTMRMQPVTLAGKIDGSRLTLSEADGARRIYQRCNGDAPTRTWEME